jgi:hypothetical protein
VLENDEKLDDERDWLDFEICEETSANLKSKHDIATKKQSSITSQNLFHLQHFYLESPILRLPMAEQKI